MSWKFFTAAGAEKRAPSTVVNPAARIYVSGGSQSIPNTAWTAILMPTTDYQTDATMNTTANALKAPSAGKYLASHSGSSWASASTNVHARITVNGVAVTGGGFASANESSGGGAGPSTSIVLSLNAGDLVRVETFQNSGAPIAIAQADLSLVKVDSAVVSYVGVPGSLVGQEVAVGTRTSGITTAGVNFAAGASIIASDLSFTADGVSAYIIEAFAYDWYNSVAGTQFVCDLVLDTAQSVHASTVNAPGNNYATSFSPRVRIVPTAGVHTVNFRIYGSAGTTGVDGGPGGAAGIQPITMRVVKAT